MRRPPGVILYQGPSLLDGEPIVCIATFKSRNGKTGDMVQTWILRADMSPLDALALGADISICGNCRHRPIERDDGTVDRTCYVQVGQAPMAVWNAYQAGSYPPYDPARHSRYLADRQVRLGAYGDPAAVPAANWLDALCWVSGWTGYTHQARHKAISGPQRRFLQTHTMASADSPKQAQRLQATGWRTFRVRNQGDGILANEVVCLADSEGLQCIDCGLCDGADVSRRKVNITIDVHGGGKTYFKTADIIATG